METKINFSRTKLRTVTDIVTFNEEEFIKALNENKPEYIFNRAYSSKSPCWVITEYLGGNKVKYFANGWADKTPVKESMENLYSSWLIQGLQECYIEI